MQKIYANEEQWDDVLTALAEDFERLSLENRFNSADFVSETAQEIQHDIHEWLHFERYDPETGEDTAPGAEEHIRVELTDGQAQYVRTKLADLCGLSL